MERLRETTEELKGKKVNNLQMVNLERNKLILQNNKGGTCGFLVEFE